MLTFEFEPDATDLERLKVIAGELYRIASSCGELEVDCLNPDDADYHRDCEDCGWFLSPIRDEMLRLGIDLD